MINLQKNNIDIANYIVDWYLHAGRQDLPWRNNISPYSSNVYDHRIDLWSVGILAFELTTGGPPFEADDQVQTYKRIAKLDLHFPEFLSEECKDFVSSLL